jgi:acyl-CoA hydrolase
MIQAMSSDDNNMSFVLPLEVSSETRVARATDQESNWSAKQLKLDDVPSKIHNGSNIYIGSAGSTALASLTAVVSDHQLADIQIIQMIPAAQLPHLNQSLDRIRSSSFFSYRPTSYFKLEDSSSHITTEALADYTPISISSIPRLLKEKKLPVDVAIIKVTPPHKGFVSLGLGVEYTRDFVRYAKTVIAEVNLNMPWTEGPSKLSVNEIDYWVEHHEPIYSFEQMWPGTCLSKVVLIAMQ